MLLWALVVVGVATLAVLIAIVVGLVRRLGELGDSAGRLDHEVTPILEEIRRDADRVRERAERISRSLPDRSR